MIMALSDMHRRMRARNWATFVLLIAFVAFVFVVSIVKIKGSVG